MRRAGPLNRWAAARPQRVLGFFAVMLLLALGLIVWAAADPHWWFSRPRGFVAAAAVVAFLVQAAIYVPRALRASRHQ
jgi:hypothetical protein